MDKLTELVLPDLLIRNARTAPDDPVVTEVEGRSVTNIELVTEFRKWADVCRRLGVGAGDSVVTMFPNSVDAYAVWLGVASLRAVEVPVNNAYIGRMLQYVVDNSGARVVIVAARFLPQFLEVAASLARIEAIVVVGAVEPAPDAAVPVLSAEELLAEGSPDGVDDEGPHPWDVTAMIYTSGTTGPSKGVLVPWGQLTAMSSFWTEFPEPFVTPGSGYYSTQLPFHLAGKIPLYTAAMCGARAVLRETFSPSRFWDDVRRFDCTGTGIFGPMATMLYSAEPRPDDRDHPLRTVMFAPLLPDMDAFCRRFGVHVTTGYGMTEVGLVASAWEYPNHRTCGRPRAGWPHLEVRLVDEHDRPVPSGAVGELIVRSAEPWVLCLGYHGNPEKTAEAWRNGWFHTGDAFTMDEDGWLYFVDRFKDVIRRRAENISSFEVEAFVNEHPLVQESAAVGVPSELGEEEVKVCVVLEPGATLAPPDLIAFLEGRMPRFMVPRYVEVVASLPKTDATWRTRKAELRVDPLNAATWDRLA